MVEIETRSLFIDVSFYRSGALHWSPAISLLQPKHPLHLLDDGGQGPTRWDTTARKYYEAALFTLAALLESSLQVSTTTPIGDRSFSYG